MTQKKKTLLKLFILFYVLLVAAFFVHTVLMTKGGGKLRVLDEDLKGAGVRITQPFELKALDGTEVPPEMADALATAEVSVITTAEQEKAPVGPSLAGKTLRDPVLPAGTRLTEALWEQVLEPEIAARKEAGEKPVTAYVSGTGNIMGFDWTLVFIVINFLGLLAILYVVLWEPVLKTLDDRAATIKNDLDTAAERRDEADSLRAKYEQMMLDSKQQREQLVAEGRNEGQAERQRIVQAAQEEAEKRVARTLEDLEAAADKVRSELRAEIGGLSIDLARKVLAREVNEKDNEQLVDDFLAKLEQTDRKE